MSDVHHFESSVHWTAKREGGLESPGLPPLEIAAPPEFGGPGERWTPEHLFVSSANACVMMTFLAIAEFSKLPVRGWRSEAKGTLEKVEGEGYRFTSIDIEAHVEVGEEKHVERARRIVEKAEAACLVSHSLRTPVRVTAQVKSVEK
ncbi:MAG TPA: OsmC family protein [Vicinamibacteria bacterium]|nr:OsmC family protein [Vicinamibacteria bacterium]